MILNKLQQGVLSSKKRIVVITAQAGAGSTTAIILKLAQEASRDSKNNLAVYVRKTSSQTSSTVQSLLRAIPGSKWSPKSCILSFKFHGKKIKIKMMAEENVCLDEYVSCIGLDIGSHFTDVDSLISTAGKVVICDFASQVKLKDSWAYRTGLLEDVNGKATWKPSVDHVVGYSHDNPGLPSGYLDCIYKLSSDKRDLLMSVDL